MSTHAWTESRVRELHDDLVSLYEPVDRVAEHGADPTAEPGEGVRQLVTTILSQNVADANTSRATGALFDRYDDFAAIEAADHEELKETIRVAGLADQKATRIQRALAAIREETGGAYSLAFLDAMATDDAKDWLLEIKGVGPKTASVRVELPLREADDGGRHPRRARLQAVRVGAGVGVESGGTRRARRAGARRADLPASRAVDPARPGALFGPRRRLRQPGV